MYDLLELARYVINYCIDNDFDLDIKRLENTLILMQGAYLTQFGRKLFKENVCVKADIAYIYGFNSKKIWLNQKCFMVDMFNDEEEKLIQKALQYIFKNQTNASIPYNNHGMIKILSNEEIISIFKKEI